MAARAARAPRARRTRRAPAARAKHEVARDEVADQPRQKAIELGGLRLTLPDELPEVVMFDLAIVSSDAMASLRLLDAILGREQYLAVRDEFARDPEKLSGDLAGFLDKVAAEYGLTSGE